MAFVRKALQYVCYKENIDRDLKQLTKACKWSSAFQLVSGLRQLGDLEMPAGLLQEVFPHVSIWASWVPDSSIIQLWDEPILDPYREALADIFDLEGPDTSGNLLSTLRHSSPRAPRNRLA